MIDHDEDEPAVLIDLEQEVMVVRLIEDKILPSRLNISAELIPGDDLTDELFDIAITKVRFWIEAIMSRCIIFARDNKAAMAMLIDEEGRGRADNLLMLCPEEPTDQHIATLLQAKLTALAGHVIFGSVLVKSTNMQGLTFRFVGHSEEVLPEPDEWLGERRYFDEPWWLRDDASTLDVVPPEGADLEEKPTWAHSLDFLARLGQKQQDIVINPSFSPTVIDGGKDD